MLVLLAAAHFIFMATEATLLDTPSCITEITEVHSSVLFDLLLGFAVSRRAVDADVEDRATPEGWEKELLGEGFGEGLRRALRLEARIFL